MWFVKQGFHHYRRPSKKTLTNSSRWMKHRPKLHGWNDLDSLCHQGPRRTVSSLKFSIDDHKLSHQCEFWMINVPFVFTFGLYQLIYKKLDFESCTWFRWTGLEIWNTFILYCNAIPFNTWINDSYTGVGFNSFLTESKTKLTCWRIELHVGRKVEIRRPNGWMDDLYALLGQNQSIYHSGQSKAVKKNK